MRWLVALVAIIACRSTRVPALAPATSSTPTASLTIHAVLPGVSATSIAAAVATPLERRFGQIAKLANMTSRSVRGETTISLGFTDTPLDVAAREVQQAIDAARPELPNAMPTPPTYRKVGDDPPVLRLGLRSEALPLADVAAYAESAVAQALAQVAGVGDVAVCGSPPMWKIEIDLQSLARFGKTIEDVLADVVASSGSATSPDFVPTPFLRDVAARSLTIRSTCGAFAEGKRVVAVTVVPQPGADRADTRRLLDAQLPSIRKALPQAIDLRAEPDDLTDDFEVITSAAASVQLRYQIASRFAEVATLVEVGVDRRGELAPTTIALHANADARVAIEQAAQLVPGVALYTPGALAIELQGPDQAALHDTLSTMIAALRAATIPVQGTLGDEPGLELEPIVDRDQMAKLGITSDVAVEHALALLRPEGIRVGSSAIPIIVTAREPALERIYVNTTPLSAFVRLESKPEQTVVLHRGQFPVVVALVGGSRAALDAALATIRVPVGIVRTVQP
jgi:multidrug efflux pump subunit AcrB